ncbi:prophage tail gpP-like protein [Paraburkholderia sp. BL8N3]|nr:hypothetical protein [Paraburkholderia sp. BL8N3]TCK36731.1 prophage tail gpP-like protein [Paraburkholderia sp. BL8N3]
MSEVATQEDLTLSVATCLRAQLPPQPNSGSGSVVPTGASYTTTNARKITGWTNVRVTRGVERCPSDFEIEFTEPYPEATNVIVQPGDECKVYLGSDLVLTGFVDRYTPSYRGREHTIRVAGRSKCQDLVDCSARWTGGQLINMPLLQIAQRLCAAYAIPVALAAGADQGLPIPQLNILVGEPIYDVLERLCRFRGLLLYDQPDGSLLLSGVGTEQAASGFKEGVNVEAAAAMYAMDGRFSNYDAVRQALDTCQDIGDAGNLIETVYDSQVPRFRYRAIVSEQVMGGPDVAKLRAEWEMARRVGRSFDVRITTDTWRDSAGKLWTPNTLVTIDLPGLKMRPQTWLIAEVHYRRDNNRGTTADLVIMPPQAFVPQPIMLYPIAPDITR